MLTIRLTTIERKTLRLHSLSVTRLFGDLSYELHGLDDHSSIFIIGDNGSGKTTLFKMISAVAKGNWQILHETNFQNFKISFIDNAVVHAFAFRNIDYLEWQNPDSEWLKVITVPIHEYLHQGLIRDRAQWIYENDPEVMKASCGRHWRTQHKEHMSDIRLVKWWEELHLKDLSSNDIYPKNPQNTLDLFEGSVPNRTALKDLDVQLIGANRLHGTTFDPWMHSRPTRPRSSSKELDPIDAINGQIRELIRDRIVSAYTLRSTIDVDSLNEWMNNEVALPDFDSIKEIASKITDLGERVSAFTKSPPQKALDFSEQVEPDKLGFLHFFLSSRLDQMTPIEDLMQQIELFLSICNSSMYRKKVLVNESSGLVIRSQKTDENIPLLSLSSGEQHLIVLAFRITLGLGNNNITLIDEPELSLHARWQKNFSSILESVSEHYECQFICATHSPYIAYGKRSAVKAIKFNG